MRKFFTLSILVLVITVWFAIPRPASANSEGEFSLQVTPAPLTATVKPGQSTTVELKVRNTGLNTEELKIEPRNFTFSSNNQSIEINDTSPAAVADWLHFSSPTFTVLPGQGFTQKIDIALPKEAGFSYSFVLLISRSNEEASKPNAGRSLKGSVAIFSLINVDRPDAVRKLEVTSFSASKSIYENLPTELILRIKNTGNSIIQPAGNVFIQRNTTDNTPISILPVNQSSGFVLPGTEREFKVTWNEGFNGDWRNIANLRFGQYAAKAVVVYDDGHRDIPTEKTATFWVIPWTLLFGALLVVSVLGFGIWSLTSKILRASKRPKPIRFDRK